MSGNQKRLILILSIFVSINSSVGAKFLPDWQLSAKQHGQSEYLLYQLSYSGFITAYIWKDLANVLFQNENDVHDFTGMESCDLSMQVSTESYILAESLRPTRFHWHSIINPEVTKSYLVEKIDLDTRHEYEVMWIDWKHKKFNYYKTLEKEQVYIDESDEDNGFDLDNASFYSNHSPVKNIQLLLHTPDKFQDRTGLIHIQSLNLTEKDQIIDPLSFLYIARWNNYKKNKKYVYGLAYKNEIRKYSWEFLRKETITIHGKPVPTLKLEAKRLNTEIAESEGFMQLWITQDNRRIPVRYVFDGGIGDIRMEISENSLLNYNEILLCRSLKVNASVD